VIHICIRHTLEWQNEEVVAAGLLPSFRAKYDVWNATFDMPYHVFRHRLKQIAQLNLSRVEGAVQSRLTEVPAGHVVVPVDDDDWFAPDLATRLNREQDARCWGYLWRLEVIELPRPLRHRLRRVARWLGRRERLLCHTNNYAFVNDPERALLGSSHSRASAAFEARRSGVKAIPAVLAVQNRNLASRTTLAWGRPSIRREELTRLLARYRDFYAGRRPTAELRWAQPYVDLVAELTREVRVK
jgi:hypothetical protein